MTVFRNLPIRSKVVLVTMLTACLALLLAGAALLWFEVSGFRKKLERDIASLANVIAANSVAAVSFDDRRAATEMLGALRVEPKILAAAIYDETGSTLATYHSQGFHRPVPSSPRVDGFVLVDKRLTYFAPIQDERELARIGTIYFEANFDELSQRLLAFARLLGGVLAASGLVALVLSAALQRYITGPIVKLAGAMKRVSHERDYALRVSRDGTDELGELVEGFNTMLGQMQSRDAALQAARDTLEKRVEERTAELQMEVAERRRAEHEVAHSLSLTTATLDSTADGILVVDERGGVVNFNQKFAIMWRIPPEVVETRDDRQLIASVLSQLEDPDAFVRRVQALYQDSKSETYDLIHFADGRVFERYSQPHRVAGESVGRVWSFRDITARMRDEDRIRELASLLDLAQDAIVVRDVEDRTLYWNKGAERLLGWSAAEVVGEAMGPLFKNDALRFVEARQSVLTDGEWAGELVQIGKNGRELRTESRWTLLRDGAGRPKSVLTISTDVTERKKLEGQVLRAQRMESIGTLAGGIAHDLNNMLSPILMSVELLRVQKLDADTQALLELIEMSAERGAGLVRQILQFARGADGKRIPLSVERVIREVCKIARDTFPKNLQFCDSIASNLWSVSGDATQIHQVLLNLCVNARDAMPDGGKLVVEATNFQSSGGGDDLKVAPAAGPYVVIRVTDTGAGIPPELREKIFEPFFTTKDVGEGTGLGLSTAVAIMKGHNGSLDFESESGKGTTFTICLPALPAAAADAQTDIGTLPAGQNELVLLVDDEASIRLVIKQTLEYFGYRVVAEPDGARAVATYAARQQDISAVITDMMMPGMDGDRTIRALKAIDPNVRVIAASGLMSDARVLAATEAGAVAFLRKPYSAEVLLHTLRQLIHPGGPSNGVRANARGGD